LYDLEEKCTEINTNVFENKNFKSN